MLIYKILSALLFPFIELWIFYRTFKGKEDKSRQKEKFGITLVERPDGEILWIHAVSVGEAKTALILVDEILKKRSDLTILFTTTTLTSAGIVAKKAKELSGKLIHQFVPVDSYYQVRKFLNYWQPKIVIFFESEIWPNLITESKKDGAKVYLVNARMSDKSIKRWKIAHNLFFRIFNKFDKIFVQSNSDIARFKSLTKNEVLFLGNLKSQISEIVIDEDELKKLKKQIGKRPILLAASTHRGEEEIILNCHQKLRQDFPDLLTINVIRHPNRTFEVEKIYQDTIFTRRSRSEEISADDEIYLVDTIGELNLFYKLADFAVICGSLIDKIGGHNPFEAIMSNAAVISGQYVDNFAESYNELSQNNSCIIVKDSNELYDKVKEFIVDPSAAKNLAKNAKKNFDVKKDISKKIVDEIF